MKLLITGLLIFSTQIFAKQMLRAPSSFIMKQDVQKTSKMNCYSNCGDSCYVLTKYQSKNKFSSKEKELMNSEAKSLCEMKTANISCLEEGSENDLLHSEMCMGIFDDAEEGVSASVDIDHMIKMAE